MVWAGSPFAHYVEFSTGSPTGAVSYELRGNDGSVLLNQTVTPDLGAAGQLLVIPGAHNTCSLPLAENRTLVVSYLTTSAFFYDQIKYRVERNIPFAVSAEGVRGKLGIGEHEIKDEDVKLLEAYAEFAEMVDLTGVDSAGDRTTLLATSAIEALAALSLIPSLQLRAAQRETSGTNEYSRFNKIDWEMLRDHLLMEISVARAALDPSADSTGAEVFSFGTAPRETDAITGS